MLIMPYIKDTFRFFNEKSVIFCVTRQISQSQVENLQLDLTSGQNTIDAINQFGYYGGVISGDLHVSGNLSYINSSRSSSTIYTNPFLLSFESGIFSINKMIPKSGQIWINGDSGNAEIYLDSSGENKLRFQTYSSTGIISVPSGSENGSHYLRINSSMGHEYLVGGNRSLSIYQRGVNMPNILEVGETTGFVLERDSINLDYGRTLIDSISVNDYCGVFYDFHIEDWYRLRQESLFVTWPPQGSEFASGSYNEAGDSFNPMNGIITDGKFKLYWTDNSTTVSFTKKMIKI